MLARRILNVACLLVFFSPAFSLAAADRESDARVGRDRPLPTEAEIAAFHESYIHPKTGVKLTFKIVASQPPYVKVLKPGKGLSLRKLLRKKYESGVIPYRLNATFKYEETNKDQPAAEKNKFGAYYTPPIDAAIIVKDGKGNVLANFDQPLRELCYH